MVPEWFEASRTLKGAITLTGVIFVVFNVSFFSPYWLQSFPDERLPNPKFTNLGRKKLRTKIICDKGLLIGSCPIQMSLE